MAKVENGAASPAGRKRSPLVALLILVLAIGVFAVAFFYAGGMDYVNQLMGAAPAGSTPATTTPSVPQTSTVKPVATDVPTNLQKRMYIEQIESAYQIGRLANGETTMFTVDKVSKQSDTETWLSITAQFATEPKTMKGVLAFTQVGGKYYFLWIQNLTGAAATPDALMTTQLLTEDTAVTEEQLASVGVKSIDQGVLNTIISSQAENQSFVAGLVDGSYSIVTLKTPVTGPGTVTIPVTLSGGKAPEANGSVKLITKQIDGKDFTFVASFEKQ